MPNIRQIYLGFSTEHKHKYASTYVVVLLLMNYCFEGNDNYFLEIYQK